MICLLITSLANIIFFTENKRIFCLLLNFGQREITQFKILLKHFIAFKLQCNDTIRKEDVE